jgi:hypothetical protein
LAKKVKYLKHCRRYDRQIYNLVQPRIARLCQQNELFRAEVLMVAEAISSIGFFRGNEGA